MKEKTMDEIEFKKKVKEGFNQAAEGYDSPALRFFDHGAERLVRKSGLKETARVLDAATGTGKTALHAARVATRGSVLGIDLSNGMLARAEKKAAEEGLNHVSFVCSDIESCDLEEGAYDAIFCSNGVFFWSDMQKTLKHILKSLKPGGLFAMSSFADGSFMPQSDLCLNRFQQYGVKLPESYTWHRLDHPDKHRDLLKAAGFSEIETSTEAVGYYLTGPEEWWDLILYTGFRTFLNQLSPEQARRYKEEHLEEIAGTADEKGIYLNVRSIFSIGRGLHS